MSGLFYRSFRIEAAPEREDARYVDLSFSSETPYMRWFGNEVLLHGEDNVDLTRLEAMGSGLLNHNPNQIVGRISDVRLGGDRRGYARFHFDDDETGNMAFAKVRSGSLRGVSVGYVIETGRRLEDGEEWEGYRGPGIIATRWTPYEISLTPIPADHSVGVNRSLDHIQFINQRSRKMTKEEVQELIRSELAGIRQAIEAARTPQQPNPPDEPDGLTVSVESARNLLSQAGAVSAEMKSKVAEMIFEGRSEREIYQTIIEGAVHFDARDNGGHTPEQPDEPRGLSFRNVTDDQFWAGIMQPALTIN